MQRTAAHNPLRRVFQQTNEFGGGFNRGFAIELFRVCDLVILVLQCLGTPFLPHVANRKRVRFRCNRGEDQKKSSQLRLRLVAQRAQFASALDHADFARDQLPGDTKDLKANRIAALQKLTVGVSNERG